MTISKKQVYAFHGKDYANFDKAKQAAEEEVHKLVTRIVLAANLGHADAYRLTLQILENRAELRALLDYPDSENDCEAIQE
jgi:hypothetical protein